MKPTWRSSLLMALGAAGVLVLILAECSVQRSGAEPPPQPSKTDGAAKINPEKP
jgi:hypothetical protein